jgi:hypothetical protein
MRFKQFVENLTSIETGQAIEAHEPNGEESVSILNPNLRAEINYRLTNELNDMILSADQGIQKIRKTLHRYGFDLPSLYEPDREGDELVIEISQYGLNELESNVYILYYLGDKGNYEFYAEVGDDDRMEELIADGVEENE